MPGKSIDAELGAGDRVLGIHSVRMHFGWADSYGALWHGHALFYFAIARAEFYVPAIIDRSAYPSPATPISFAGLTFGEGRETITPQAGESASFAKRGVYALEWPPPIHSHVAGKKPS